MATWVATPELFPTELRATGHASCASMSKLCSFCVPFLVTSSLSYEAIGWCLGTFSLIAAAMAHALPDTAHCELCV